MTKDYANSGLHRFKKPGSKNYQNIYPPSATLHLSNIPSGVEEDDLRKAFQNINISVQVSPTLTGTTRSVAGGSSSAEKRRSEQPAQAAPGRSPLARLASSESGEKSWLPGAPQHWPGCRHSLHFQHSLSHITVGWSNQFAQM